MYVTMGPLIFNNVWKQGSTFRLMLSNLELTQDHVLQVHMLGFFNCRNKWIPDSGSTRAS